MRNSYLRYTLPLFLEILSFLQQVHLREANTFIDLLYDLSSILSKINAN